MEDQTKINELQRTIGVLTTNIGLASLKKSFGTFEKSSITSKQINDAFSNAGIKITITELDYLYQTTNWDNWEKITKTLYGIIKPFPWTKEYFDCDQRSSFITATCGLLFSLNTCAGIYCKITNTETGNSDMHWANLIIDKNGGLYLFDVDNGGLTQKITSNNIVMGKWRYELQSLRIY